MKRTLARLWRGARAIRALFPLTNLGVLVAALAALTYFEFALPRADYVLQLVSAFSMFLVGLFFFSTVPGALMIRRTVKRLAPSEASGSRPIIFEAHRGFAQGLRMPQLKWFPLLEYRWEWEGEEDIQVELVRDDTEIFEQLTASDRSSRREIKRRFVVEDPFGLVRVVFRHREARAVRVLPWPGNLGAAPMFRSHAGGDELPHPAGELVGDRVDMRHYVRGDPLRLVLWKVYARTRELMVRTPERAITPSLRIVAYLPRASHDEPAAAAARVAVSAGLLGEGWRFGADGTPTSAADEQSALELVVDSKNAEPGQAEGLGRFLQSVEGSARTRLVLFLPGLVGPWLDNVRRQIRGFSGAITAIIVVDGIDHGSAERAVDRWLRVPEGPGGRHLVRGHQLSEVIENLASLGVDVVCVNRPQGRLLPVGDLRRKRVA